ncbi:efflux RND transporter periplasmic adaptor subunit [Microbulbifer agarilyticus]|uniref:efflux RND transporter periplasmic adaptor subunit n=1 Tax=Microbulbifer agarilyticus TaxID=260552 RepID=UPI0009869603|nr:efflux RND transporter periplasmic adaptor subunit [Microbulbifer agarilyticus]
MFVNNSLHATLLSVSVVFPRISIPFFCRGFLLVVLLVVLSAVLAIAGLGGSAYAGEDDHQGDPHEHQHESEHGHQDKHEDEHHHEENTLSLTDEALAHAALTIASAGPVEIARQVTLHGKLQPEPTSVSHLRARYPGVISSVNVHIGALVKKSQVLATINSNESLQEYQLRAPFDGMVIAKHAGPGEFARDQVLFAVADYAQLWAELQVFPARIAQVRPGQTVTVTAGDQSAIGTVRSLVPADSGAPYSRARVAVDNQNGNWVPGIFVQGAVTVEKKATEVAVDNRALQELDRATVVFVKTAPGRFEARPVALGVRDNQHTEVLSGLDAGEEYVVENSFLLKAELKKSAAGHAH